MYRGRSGPTLSERAVASGVGAPAQEPEREPVGSASPEPPVPRPFALPRPVRPRELVEHPPTRAAPAAPVAAATPVAAPVAAAARAAPAAAGRQARHCWVRDPPDSPGSWPGLLVEWRQQQDGWHGRVAYAVTGPRGAVLIEAWLPAEQLTQG